MKRVVTLIYCDYPNCRAKTHSHVSLQFRRKQGWTEREGAEGAILDLCPEHVLSEEVSDRLV